MSRMSGVFFDAQERIAEEMATSEEDINRINAECLREAASKAKRLEKFSAWAKQQNALPKEQRALYMAGAEYAEAIALQTE